jgi:hypothetical protein
VVGFSVRAAPLNGRRWAALMIWMRNFIGVLVLLVGTAPPMFARCSPRESGLVWCVSASPEKITFVLRNVGTSPLQVFNFNRIPAKERDAYVPFFSEDGKNPSCTRRAVANDVEPSWWSILPPNESIRFVFPWPCKLSSGRHKLFFWTPYWSPKPSERLHGASQWAAPTVQVVLQLTVAFP